MSEELRLLNKFKSDNHWLNSNYEKLQKEHPNEFVAIEEKKFLGSNKTIEKLLQELKSKNFDTSMVLIEFIPEKGLKIIL